jgi:hypothetical protein
MLLFVRSKRTAFAAAAFVVAGWCAGGGVASADPHVPPPGPSPGPQPGPAPKTTLDHDGTYVVGTDVAPGTYSSAGPVEDGTCYWKRLGSASNNDIIDNSMSKKPQVVQIAPTDKAFKTDGCQPWQKNDAASPDPGKPPGGGNLLNIIGGLINPSAGQQPSGGQQPPKP